MRIGQPAFDERDHLLGGYWLSFGALVHCASCGNEEPRETVGLLERVAQEGS